MTKMQMKTGDELKGRIKLLAKGASFVPPSLPFDGTVKVQLNNDLACWEASYSPTSEENTSGGFDAESE